MSESVRNTHVFTQTHTNKGDNTGEKIICHQKSYSLRRIKDDRQKTTGKRERNKEERERTNEKNIINQIRRPLTGLG